VGHSHAFDVPTQEQSVVGTANHGTAAVGVVNKPAKTGLSIREVTTKSLQNVVKGSKIKK
jgi:hypothetical protein